jgi:hypothetical protein
MPPTYPDVPDTPGVPPVFRAGATPDVPPLTGDDFNLSGAAVVSWGVFDSSGAVAIDCDSFVSLEYLREFRISDYPVEDGGFSSYDKVATPIDLRVVVTRGGTDDDRVKFLAQIDAAVATTDLFGIVTPDSAYYDLNLVRYDYKRSSTNGATLLMVELQFVEVRLTATQNFSSSKAPAGADAVNDGAVQAKAPSAAQTPVHGPI